MTPRAGDELVARAARELRDEPQPAWIDISASVLAKVRAATRHGWPVRANLEGLDQQGADTIHISDRVAVSRLRIALATLDGCSPARIELRLEGDRCTGALVDVVVAYGVQVHALANRARETTARTLSDVLGPLGQLDIDVNISDVTSGDPRL